MNETEVGIIKEYITSNEGKRLEVYFCTEGYPTIGIGHRLRKGENLVTITEEQCDDIFTEDFNNAVADARSIFKNYDDLPFEARLVLTDMAFQLGRGKLSKFVQLRAAVNAQNWNWAQEEIRDSRYYTQVKRRASKNIAFLGDLI